MESTVTVLQFYKITGLSTSSGRGVDKKHPVIARKDVHEFQTRESQGCGIRSGNPSFEIFRKEQTDSVVAKDRISHPQDQNSSFSAGQARPLFREP